MTQRRRDRRSAFTLVEMVVVIAIIAILVSLTAAAVIRLLNKGPESQTRADIGDLDMALSKMKSQCGLTYLPSRLHLSKTNNYGNNPLDLDSKAFLQARFGRDCCCKFTVLPSNLYPNVPFIDWNGDGNANEELYLEGEQVLVFLLGGIPKSGNGSMAMTGFSNTVTNPAQPGGSRQAPFFEFQPTRLKAFTSSLPGNTGAFPVYLDDYTPPKLPPQPFLFFSSYGAEGGGNYNKYGGPDTSVAGVQPYFTIAAIQNQPAQYVSPGTWQIISAGADGAFGPGGLWNPAAGYVSGPGADDQANFSPHKLGTAAN